ncbi:MAG: hypothetical protein K9W42_12295 [Candidatus Heimdallarchaeota archaeon]|nr:hypothetical protein [Candidatus Heimdallarchaeota archaeon]
MKRRVQISFVISIIVGMTITTALSNPVPGIFAIQLENNDSINSASEVLKRNIPGISIIEYKSLKYDLIAHRIITPSIWIGHGDVQGIATENELLSWDDFSKEISITPAKDIVLACHSNKLLEQSPLTQKDVFTFNGEVDSTFGALVTAFLITKNEKIIEVAINHINALYTGEVQYEPLKVLLDPGPGGGGTTAPIVDIPETYEEAITDHSYVFAKLSGVEFGYHILMLVIMIFNLAVGFAGANAELNFFQTFAIQFYVLALPALLFSLVLHSRGSLSDDQLCENVFGSFNDGFDAFVQAWHKSSAGDKAAIIAMLVAGGIIIVGEALLDIFCGGAGTIIRTAATIAVVLLWIYGFACDCADANTYVG